jgi:hypothetical protein
MTKEKATTRVDMDRKNMERAIATTVAGKEL